MPSMYDQTGPLQNSSRILLLRDSATEATAYINVSFSPIDGFLYSAVQVSRDLSSMLMRP
jgi:hypothetical protein